MRTPGYNLTVKMFIPAPKTDFKAQAKAAEMAGQAVESGTITPELLAAATVLEVKGNYGTADLPEPVVDKTDEIIAATGGTAETTTETTEAEKTDRKGRQNE